MRDPIPAARMPMTPDAIATLHQQILSALSAVPAETRRLFHGRGRLWPGLEQVTVDWLQGVVQISLFRAPEAQGLAALKEMLTQIGRSPAWASSGAHTLLLQHRYRPDSMAEWLLG